MRTWIRGVAILLVGVTAMCCSHVSDKVQLDAVEGSSMRVIERSRAYTDGPLPEADVFENLFQGEASEVEVEAFKAAGEPLWLYHDDKVLADEELSALQLRVYLRTTSLLRRVVIERD